MIGGAIGIEILKTDYGVGRTGVKIYIPHLAAQENSEGDAGDIGGMAYREGRRQEL